MCPIPWRPYPAIAMSFDSPAGRGATYAGGFGRNWVLTELWLGQTQTVLFMEGCIIFSFLCGRYKTCYSFDPDCPFWWGWLRRKRWVGFSKGSQMLSSTGQYGVMRSIKLNCYSIRLCCRGLSRFFFCRPIFFEGFPFCEELPKSVNWFSSHGALLHCFIRVSSPKAVTGRIFMVGLH